MPKGVEHASKAFRAVSVAAVPTSVMPKGVEHDSTCATLRRVNWGADLCDAERR